MLRYRQVSRRVAPAAATKRPRPVTGTVAFTPASGPGGRRTIYALVFRDGVFQRHLTVGSYVAPSPSALAAPTVGVIRRWGRLVFKIGRVTGATSYLLALRALDGRRERIDVTVKSRSVTITPFPAADAATATVAAESGRGSTGRVTTVRVTPVGIRPSGGSRSAHRRRPRRR